MWKSLEQGISERDKRNDEEDFYRILGCDETANDEQIIAEYRTRALKYHPDKNFGNNSALIEFQRLQEAKNVLLDSKRRKSYDKWKNSQVCISFKKWENLSSHCGQTMHWSKPRSQTMIQEPLDAESTGDTDLVKASKDEELQFGNVKWGRVDNQKWSHEGSRIYSLFRNYQI